MTINYKNETIEITKHEVQDSWVEENITLDEETMTIAKTLEKELKKEGLTLNDYIVSMVMFMLKNPDKAEKLLK